MNYIYAANRDIGCWVLKFLLKKGHSPLALLLADEDDKNIREMINMAGLPSSKIYKGKSQLKLFYEKYKNLEIDYIFGIHYPLLINNNILSLPKYGCLNLHPAYLPFNKGWHTPSWSILEESPAGATLHLMSSELDTGDILHQKEVKVAPEDTANSLYQKIKRTEYEVFTEAFDHIVNFTLTGKPQDKTKGSIHKKKDLFDENISKINLEEKYLAKELINKIRALTTNDITEACYFIEDEKKYRIRVDIQKVNDV